MDIENNTENLFVEGDQEQQLVPENQQKQENETQQVENNGTEIDKQVIEPNNLFDESESVGNEKNMIREKGKGTATNSAENTGDSSFNVFSSIAEALKKDGVFSNLDNTDSISDATSFADAIRNEISSLVGEEVARVKRALDADVSVNEVQQYEQVINYLSGITDEQITDESNTGENLRKTLIYSDFINRGYSKERAEREVKKSFDAATDIEDAKEALVANRDFFKNSYQNLIQDKEKEKRAYEEELNNQNKLLRDSIFNDKNYLSDINLDNMTRQKIYNVINKPIYTDEHGNKYSELQKYQKENKVDFLRNIATLYVLTDKFTNINKIISPKIKAEMNKNLKNIEKILTTSSNSFSDGNLSFAEGGLDSDSDKKGSVLRRGWNLDI